MRIFFSVGEPSGDQHAAHMIAELKRRRDDFECIGFGGPEMRAAGCRVDFQLTDLAVMGVLKVIPMLSKFIATYRMAKRILDADQPDAVMLVDFPGFNWWIAKAAKKRGIPVFYYLPPQLWAWGAWRVKRVQRLIDHVMSSLQFETDWYRSRGIDCHFVGHPFFDEVSEHSLDSDFMAEWSTDSSDARNVAILPGSRGGEVTRNWPVLTQVMQRIHAKHPDVRFLVAAFKPKQLEYCQAQLKDNNVDLPIHFFTGKTPEIIQSGECCLMVSGSVSLELLARRIPAVAIARLGWVEKTLSPLFITCEYISLPNLIAGRQIMPEYLTGSDSQNVDEMTAHLDEWLSDESARQARITEMEVLCTDVVQTGATARAVDYVISEFPDVTTRKVA